MITLYKRNAQGKPLVWSIDRVIQDITRTEVLFIKYGIVGGNLHEERVVITKSKVDELQSRVNAKRKEGYKEINELKDGITFEGFGTNLNPNNLQDALLIKFLDTYLPKYSTTSEGFVLPMLAKVLEDNKPFEKYGDMLGQWKINGLRCIIGARETQDMFNPIELTYHSRTGENWTNKLSHMDDIILPKIDGDLLDMMIEEGACLDGELYLPGYAVNDINSFVKNPALKQHYLLQYWCYDICCENMSAEKRLELRENSFDTHPLCIEDKYYHLDNKKQFVLLPTFEVSGIASAINYRNKFIDLGFEGLILRNPSAEYQFGKRNQAMFKFKKIDDGLFEVVDIKEDKRGLPIYTLKNDINDELFDATINISQEAQRNQLAIKDSLIGKKAFVEYRERSGVKQVPFHAKIIKIYV